MFNSKINRFPSYLIFNKQATSNWQLRLISVCPKNNQTAKFAKKRKKTYVETKIN